MAEPATSDELNPSRMLFRLQVLAALGCFLVLIYSIQFSAWRDGLRVAAVGVAIAGATALIGLLFGFIFCYPRIKKGQVPAGSLPDPAVEDNTSLADISDWLTKILVGVGLIELTKIPHSLHLLSVALAPGLQTSNAGPSWSGQVFALALLVYFFPLGFMFGFIWTRFYYQEKLKNLLSENQRLERDNEAKRKALEDELSENRRLINDLKAKQKALEDQRKASNLADLAEQLIYDRHLNSANEKIEEALLLDGQNAKALFLRARILKEQAWVPSTRTWDKHLLEQALHYAGTATALVPDKASPLYNMACYQALLHYPDKEVAASLRRAFEIHPQLAGNADQDADLEEAKKGSIAIKDLIAEYKVKSANVSGE